MAKIACPECGHKNKSSEYICSKCGFYLGDMGTSSSAEVVTPEPQQSQPFETQPEQFKERTRTSSEVLKVKTRGSFFSVLPIALSIGILIVLYYLIYAYSIPIYYLAPILILLFILPSLARRMAFPIKFTQTGFSIPQGGSSVDFQFNNIEEAVVSTPMRGVQEVMLSLKQDNRNITLDFDQMISLRHFLIQLQRRRIPVSIQRPQAPNGPV